MATRCTRRPLRFPRFADEILPAQVRLSDEACAFRPKLRFKNPKHIMSMFVTTNIRAGYWRTRATNWFSGKLMKC